MRTVPKVRNRPPSRARLPLPRVRSLLSSVRASPAARLAFLAIAATFCGYGLAVEWPGMQAALGLMRWYLVAGSVVAAMAGAGAMMLAWRALLADLGSPLPVAAAARITFVGQLGKYVPGAIWSFAAHVELGYDRYVPRRRGAASVVLALGVTLAVGLAIAAVGLPLASAAATRHYWWALAATPVIVACLCPPVLGRLTDRVLGVIRLPPLERWPTWRGLAVAVGWTAVGWLLLGLQVWVLLASETGRGTAVLLLAVSGYALATSASLVLVVFPGGIGPREVILIAALAPVLDRPAALALALLARATTTISDLAWGGIGLAIGRSARARTTRSG
jgi:glycosyltransferase 2 family protein